MTERYKNARLVASGEFAQGREVAVIVVIVAQQNRVDARQRFEDQSRRVKPARSKKTERTDAFTKDRIGDHIHAAELKKKRGVIDPRGGDVRIVFCASGRSGARCDDVRFPTRFFSFAPPTPDVARSGQRHAAGREEPNAVAMIGNGKTSHGCSARHQTARQKRRETAHGAGAGDGAGGVSVAR